jgi:hypothetical protein
MKYIRQLFHIISFAFGLYLAFAFAFIPLFLFGKFEDFVKYVQWEWRQRVKEGV